MSDIEFAWDTRKAAANHKKHSVSFEEALSVFYDEHARQICDPDNSLIEPRFILIGMSSRLRVIVICHCFRESDFVIRIMSARKANARERQSYEGNR